MCHKLILFSQQFPKTAKPESASKFLFYLQLPTYNLELNLDIAHLHRRVILPVPALNLVLVPSLELQHRQFLRAPLLNDLARHRSFLRLGAHKHFFVPMDRQDVAKIDLLPYFACHPLDADGVAGRDTILLPPGLYDGVHLSSRFLPGAHGRTLSASSRPTETPIIRAVPNNRQRGFSRVIDSVAVSHPGLSALLKCSRPPAP